MCLNHLAHSPCMSLTKKKNPIGQGNERFGVLEGSSALWKAKAPWKATQVKRYIYWYCIHLSSFCVYATTQVQKIFSHLVVFFLENLVYKSTWYGMHNMSCALNGYFLSNRSTRKSSSGSIIASTTVVLFVVEAKISIWSGFLAQPLRHYTLFKLTWVPCKNHKTSVQ